MTVHVDTSLSSDWLAVLSATSEPGTDVEHETRLLRRVDRPHTYFCSLPLVRRGGVGGWVGGRRW
jgi:hypothetical protein